MAEVVDDMSSFVASDHLNTTPSGTGVNERVEQALRQLAQSLVDSHLELDGQTSLMRAVLENLGDGVVVADATGCIVLFNPAAVNILGVGQTSELPDKWSETYGVFQADGVTLLPTDELPLVRALRGEGCDRVELFIRNAAFPEGTWISVTGRPLKNEAGQVTGGVVVFHDVTGRRRAERTRQFIVAHRSLTDFVENATVGLHWVGADGLIEWANRAELDMLGYSRDEYVGQPIAKFRADAEVSDDILCRLQRGETLKDREARLICKDGSIKHVLINSNALTEGGQFIRSRCFTRDITEQKRAQARVEEQAALFDNATDAIIVCDFDGHIRYWNHGAERLYGWTAIEAIGHRDHELLFRSIPAILHTARQSVAGSGAWRGELCQVTRDGRGVLVESHWTLIRDSDGRPQSMFKINSDVTEQRELETRFLRTQRMESIGTLAGGIAHDLNNVLTPILLGIDLLKSVISETDHAALLGPLQDSAEHGAEMVKQVLSFARGVQGERVEPQLKHIIRDLHKMFERTLPCSIQMQVRIPRDLWPIHGDPTQLHQVLMNLCVNARDAMPNGGKLEVTAENVQLDAIHVRERSGIKHGPHVQVTVTDTGTGIPADIMDKIFDPFFTTKEVGKGTGLGLSTALGIVKSHGGFVSVTSELGLGTQFSVCFPAASIEEGLPTRYTPHEALPNLTAHDQLILMVEDDAAVREFARTALERQGYCVMCAGDGAEAVAVFALHRHEIQAVVTDMEMPGLHGLSVIRILHELSPHVRIVITSGAVSDASLAEAARIGVSAIVSKPFSTNTLLTVLHDLLHRGDQRLDSADGTNAVSASATPQTSPALLTSASS
jgi:PAS domain S-box-containing protein